MNRRVVVTGMGVITPVGNDVRTYWNSLLDGVCGIDFVKAFPTDDLPVKPGFPIQKSAGHGIFAPNRSLSQLITSFFGS